MPATLTKPKAQKAVPKQDAHQSVTDELQRRSDATLAAYELVAALEKRFSELEPGKIYLTESEWQILVAAEIVAGRSLHELAKVLERQRTTVELRQELLDMGSRTALEASLEKATEAEAQAANKLDVIDLTIDGTTAKQFQGLQAQLRGFKSDKQSCERSLASYNRCHGALMRLAPEPIKNYAANAKQKVTRSTDARELSRATTESSGLGKLLDVGGTGSPLRDVEFSFVNGLLNGLLVRYCDGSVTRKTEQGQVIEKNLFLKRMAELRTDHLPKLRATCKRLTPIVDKAIHESQAPLRQWAIDGKFPANIL